MADRREQSREEWEQELREDQYNVLPADGSRVGHIMAKRSTSPAPIRDFAHLMLGLLGGLLIAFAVVVFSSAVPYRVYFGVPTLIVGCCLLVAAFR